jgi:acyl-coenzyme A synthetase/AMP-(fatty) acid ligase
MNSLQLFPLTERHGDEVFAYRSTGLVRVSEFVANAVSLAHRLPDHRYVINLHADRYRYMLSFYAAVIAGQCTLMPPNRQPATLAQLGEIYSDSYIVGGDKDSLDFPKEPAGRDVQFPRIPADRLCAISFTSGSTGAPQPFPKYWQTLRTGAISNEALLLGDSQETINLVATVPAQHMWGMEMSVLLPMFAKVAVCHRVPFFPQDFADVLASIPEPHVLVSTPVHLETLLKSGVRIDSISRIFTATAPLSKELAVALEERYGARVTEVFGCSESGILAVRMTSSESLWRLADVFKLRASSDGFRVSADHLPEDVTLPDVIELVGNRRFRWVGRQQDMINIAGKRGSLVDLNRRLREIPGVDDGIVFMPEGSDDRLAALVVAPGLKASDILRQLRLQVEPVFLPRPVYQVSALPRQETGKLAITAVQELFERIRESRV